jgi:hypothetical protein
MRRLPGSVKNDWGGEIDSLVVGPGAVVRVWDDEGFRGNPLVLGPGQALGNLDRSTDRGDAIESMDVRCR